jgi:hypothetical protein
MHLKRAANDPSISQNHLSVLRTLFMGRMMPHTLELYKTLIEFKDWANISKFTTSIPIEAPLVAEERSLNLRQITLKGAKDRDSHL